MGLLIHAPNVHQGGGRTLLVALLHAARGRADVAAVVDARLRLPEGLPATTVVTRVGAGVVQRLAAEWRLRSRTGPGDTVLCFGNLPPLFGAPARVLLFLQNRYLLGRRPTRGLPAAARARILVERFWLRRRRGSVHTVIVQSPSMAWEVEQQLGLATIVLPFAGPAPAPVPAGTRTRFDFLYVSSGEPHKNHRHLLAAWRLLASEGILPSLCVTVSREHYPALCAEIDDVRATCGARVENVGAVDAAAVATLYAAASAVIYPSRFESLGLPLLEARGHDLPILAAELDYVRDLLDPVESFDPDSAVSIARAVKRFRGDAASRVSILSAEQFLERVASLGSACLRSVDSVQ